MLEKKNYFKLSAIICLAVAVCVLICVSLLAPYAEDIIREKQTRIFDNVNAEPDEYSTYIWFDEEGVVLNQQDYTEASFLLNESGDWYVCAGYMALEGNGQELEYEMAVDGNSIIGSDETLTLTRVWTDSGEFRYTLAGDEIRPMQTEMNSWQEENFRVSKKNKASVYLEKGEHSLYIKQNVGSSILKYIKIAKQELPKYQEYRNDYSDAEVIADGFIEIQGESPILKSSSEITAAYDRSSPFTVPYNPTCIRYNTIGGGNWKKQGQWVEWQFESPESGLYRIGMRYRQNENKGQDSLRSLYIDGEIPFYEAANLKFDYDVDWKSNFLQENGEPYLFYLEKGVHNLRLEVSLGDKEELIDRLQGSLRDINALYREIIMITGTDPDIYRDYSLETAIPDLTQRIEKILADLNSYVEFLENNYGKGSYATRILNQVITQLQDFLDKPYTIAKRLSVFKTNIAALAEWILEFEEQPLQIDYVYVGGSDTEIPQAEGNFFSKFGHEIRAFVGSFSHSYNEVASEDSGETDVTLTVWMGRGRDQANVIKRMIDAYFTPQTGINVNISLVEGALVKATLAGQGPDVNIFTTRGEAMNLAFRGAVADLASLNEFDKVKSEYMDSAFVPYTYEGDVFAVPESQEFYMMYIRTDIFDELSLEIPKTWKDVMALLPILQSNSLAIGLPYSDGYATMGNGIGTINLYPTLLSQKGIDLYKEAEGSIDTNLLTTPAYDAFKQWSDFYVQYNFDFYKDDFNRFRTGEMPIIISSYLLYNNLTEAAPEISGQWTMLPIPGTEDEKSEINRATCASGTCSIILENCENKDAAWEFVKWWNSADAQEMYARDIEAELSTLGRYTPANLSAFENSLWRDDEKELLLSQWKEVVEVPEVPGGYYVSRNLDNALRQVFYNGENARDTYIYWMSSVNEELERKQSQIKARKEIDD